MKTLIYLTKVTRADLRRQCFMTKSKPEDFVSPTLMIFLPLFHQLSVLMFCCPEHSKCSNIKCDDYCLWWFFYCDFHHVLSAVNLNRCVSWRVVYCMCVWLCAHGVSQVHVCVCNSVVRFVFCRLRNARVLIILPFFFHHLSFLTWRN